MENLSIKELPAYLAVMGSIFVLFGGALVALETKQIKEQNKPYNIIYKEKTDSLKESYQHKLDSLSKDYFLKLDTLESQRKNLELKFK